MDATLPVTTATIEIIKPLPQRELDIRRQRVIDRVAHYCLTIESEQYIPRLVSAHEAVTSKLERELAFADTEENKAEAGHEEDIAVWSAQPWSFLQRALNVEGLEQDAAIRMFRSDFTLGDCPLRHYTKGTVDATVDLFSHLISIRQVTDIGRRPTNEDAHWWNSFVFKAGTTKHTVFASAVMDGHGSPEPSKFIRRRIGEVLLLALERYNKPELDDVGMFNALKMTVVNLDNLLRLDDDLEDENAGSTFNLTVIVDGTSIWTANTGDSRSILIEVDGEAPKTVQLSQDQSVLLPRFQRSPNRYGSTIQGNRVNGVKTARALGPYAGMTHFTPRPKITKVAVPAGGFAILQACDGLWDVMSSQAAGKAVRTAIKSGLELIPEHLVAEAITKRGSGDNVSISLVVFSLKG